MEHHIGPRIFGVCVPPPPTTPALAAISANGTTTYVELEAVNGATTHHELWLDLSNRPHRTGNTITPTPHDVITSVEL